MQDLEPRLIQFYTAKKEMVIKTLAPKGINKDSTDEAVVKELKNALVNRYTNKRHWVGKSLSVV